MGRDVMAVWSDDSTEGGGEVGDDNEIWFRLANEVARHDSEQVNGWAGPSGTLMQVRREPAGDKCHSIAVWPREPIRGLQSTVRQSQAEALDHRWPDVWYVKQQEYGFLGLGGKFRWKIVGYLASGDLSMQARAGDGYRPRVDIRPVDVTVKQEPKYMTDALGASTHDLITMRTASPLVGHYRMGSCEASFAWPCVTGATKG
ncbi:hypothetical protein ACWCQL_25080 [Streptomyces sp. NPDC002073]